MTVKQDLVQFGQWLARETKKTKSNEIYSLIESLGSFQSHLNRLGTEEEIQELISNSSWEY